MCESSSKDVYESEDVYEGGRAKRRGIRTRCDETRCEAFFLGGRWGRFFQWVWGRDGTGKGWGGDGEGDGEGEGGLWFEE